MGYRDEWAGWDAWQTFQMLENHPMALSKVQEDLRYGQEAKAQFFLMHQIIGPHNRDSLEISDNLRSDKPRRLIREDQIDWSALFALIKGLD